MKKLLASVSLLALLTAPTLAQQTKSQLNTEINTQLPDNVTGAITPAILRGVLHDMVNSTTTLADSNVITGTPLWVGPTFPSTNGLINTTGNDIDPTITPNSIVSLALNGATHASSLVFGIATTTPFPAWIQARNWAGPGAVNLLINPIPANIHMLTGISGLADGGPMLQIGDNWTNSPTYSPPGGQVFSSVLSVFGVSSSASQGIASYARTSNQLFSGIAIAGYAFADNAAQRGSWAFYGESHRITSSDYSYAMELAIVNRESLVTTILPTNAVVTAATQGIQLDCGNGVSIAVQVQYSCSSGLLITGNLHFDQVNAHSFGVGIVFRSGALDTTLHNPGMAIALPGSAAGYDYGIYWCNNDPCTNKWVIHSTASANAHTLDFQSTMATFSAAVKATDISGGNDTGGLYIVAGAETNARTYANSDLAILAYYTGTNFPTPAAFQRTLDISVGGGTSGSWIRFLTQGGFGASIARMVIDPAGQVNVATNTASTSTVTGAFVVAGGAGVGGAIYSGAEVKVGVTTVGGLPACNAGRQGAHMFVTDQNTAVAYRGAVTGGGATKQNVICDGTNWIQN